VVLRPEGRHQRRRPEGAQVQGHAAEIDFLRDHLKKMAKEAFKANIPADKYCLRDGDLSGKEEYEGHYILVCSEREDNPPLCLDIDGKRHLKKSDDKLYSGCIANVMFKFWTQDHKKGGKRINANFLGVQWIAEGERFSNVTRATEEDFESEGSGEEDGFDD
jgi:hypothetical protein